MTLKNIILSERGQTQKATYCMIPFVWIVGRRGWIIHPFHPHTHTYAPHTPHHTLNPRKKILFFPKLASCFQEESNKDFITVFQSLEWDYCSRIESILDILINSPRQNSRESSLMMYFLFITLLPKFNWAPKKEENLSLVSCSFTWHNFNKILMLYLLY